MNNAASNEEGWDRRSEGSGREISNNMEFYFAFSSILFERYRNKNSKNDKSEILPSIRYEILSRRKANEKKKRLNGSS